MYTQYVFTSRGFLTKNSKRDPQPRKPKHKYQDSAKIITKTKAQKAQKTQNKI